MKLVNIIHRAQCLEKKTDDKNHLPFLFIVVNLTAKPFAINLI